MRVHNHLPTIICLASLLGWSPVRAAAPARWRVTHRLAKTHDVRMAVQVGDAIWQATTGGLLIQPAGSTTAQPRHLTVADGLPPGQLHVLLREPDGSVWVGGDAGLVRVVQTTAGGAVTLCVLGSLKVKAVRALARHRDKLYVGTWGKGLVEVSPTYKVKAVQLGRPRLLKRVTSLASTRQGLYVGTAGAGVGLLRGGRFRRVSRRLLPSPLVWDLAPASGPGGGVWVATLGGLARVRGSKVIDTPQTRAAARLPGRDLRSVLVKQGDELLLGTYGAGLHRVRGSATRPVVGAPARGTFWRLRLDRHSKLLAATTRRVWAERGGRLVALAGLPGPASNDVSAMVRTSDGGLWIGTFDAGLSHRAADGGWRHLGLADGLIDDRINHLALQRVDGRELLWVATPRGAARLDGATWTRWPAGEDLARGHVNAVFVKGRRVYLASSGGLSIFDGKRWQRIGRRQGLPLRQATSVFVDAADTIWVGGLDGLARRPHGGAWSLLQVASGQLPNDWITALAPATGGAIWAGTYDGGLARLGATSGRPTIFREADGLPCGWVNFQALALAGETLWIGSMEGGVVLRHRGRWHQIGTAGGLPSADVTAVVPGGGGAWIGTRGGIVRIELNRTELNVERRRP